MQKIDEYILKDGRKVDIVLPQVKSAKAYTDFINKLSKEDTYLTFAGEEYSVAYEKAWLKNTLVEIKYDRKFVLWATYNGKMVGYVDLRRGGNRDAHVGVTGLMVDIDFRAQGLGKYLIEKMLSHAEKANYKIVTLNLFDDNVPAKNLYKKLGFKEWARLPEGFLRRGKYSDAIKMYKTIGGNND